jgi:hypothetical protein
MKLQFVIFAIFANSLTSEGFLFGSGLTWDDLKVTWGPNPLSWSYFVSMPRTVSEAVSKGQSFSLVKTNITKLKLSPLFRLGSRKKLCPSKRQPLHPQGRQISHSNLQQRWPYRRYRLSPAQRTQTQLPLSQAGLVPARRRQPLHRQCLFPGSQHSLPNEDSTQSGG